jgi:hypothetical protein
MLLYTAHIRHEPVQQHETDHFVILNFNSGDAIRPFLLLDAVTVYELLQLPILVF